MILLIRPSAALPFLFLNTHSDIPLAHHVRRCQTPAFAWHPYTSSLFQVRCNFCRCSACPGQLLKPGLEPSAPPLPPPSPNPAFRSLFRAARAPPASWCWLTLVSGRCGRAGCCGLRAFGTSCWQQGTATRRSRRCWPARPRPQLQAIGSQRASPGPSSWQQASSSGVAAGPHQPPAHPPGGTLRGSPSAASPAAAGSGLLPRRRRADPRFERHGAASPAPPTHPQPASPDQLLTSPLTEPNLHNVRT